VEPPNFGVTDTGKLKTVKADLGDVSQVRALFDGEEIGGVYALQYVIVLLSVLA